jgi:membrane associated rhomboid family serine protease
MNNQFGGGYFGTPPITKNLIIANFIVWLACTILPIGDAIREYGMLYWVGSEKFHAYQFFTHMFMHADFSHMFFNMFSLWMFGRMLEIDLGPKRYIIFYLVSALGASMMQMGVAYIEWLSVKARLVETAAAYGVSAAQLANQVFTGYAMLGASGAVMAVMMSFGVMHPNNMVMLMFPPIPMKAKWLVVIFIVIEFLAGVQGPTDGVAHFAHLGGMLWGWLLLRYWKKTHQIYY